MPASCWSSRRRKGRSHGRAGPSKPTSAGSRATIAALEFQRMFPGEMDSHNAFLDIQAGAGGTEAQDWAQMLMRMYLRWGDQQGFATEVIDVEPGRGRRHQERDDPLRGRIRLRLAAHRDRRASAGAQVAVRFERAPAHLVRVGVRVARDRRRHQHRDQSGGSRDGRVPVERRGRPARQQDRVGGAPPPPADRHRRRLPERAQPAQEPLDGDEDAQGQALRARGQQAQRRGARCSRTRSPT